MNRPFKYQFLTILTCRVVIFFFSMCLITLFLYAIGTAQGFMDSTQLVLLRIAAVLGLLLLIGALYGFALDLILYIRNRWLRFLGGGGIYLVLGAFGFAAAAVAFFIIAAAGGNAA
ncbi:hypothetical protein TREAZ_0350 [Leadbettera azotonutricia ZAS-9]|uniref:Major facilitator superfamily (MFS) profile domain-containing protein n=2 Tax=Leadbettera azotonutricia TaxID=150829 RepID=F5YDH6_LEAAZ|nr:hypothetical protein TREAZ_0350 [Leadbettera azotonutricia ZAS-9]